MELGCETKKCVLCIGSREYYANSLDKSIENLPEDVLWYAKPKSATIDSLDLGENTIIIKYFDGTLKIPSESENIKIVGDKRGRIFSSFQYKGFNYTFIEENTNF